MTDVTQGQDALNDAQLFSEAADSTTLEKFENPEPQQPEALPEPKKAPSEGQPPVEPPKPEPPDALVPSSRLREEAEARRRADERVQRAERERDDILRQLAAARQPQQQPQKAPDLFEDPSGYVQNQIRPIADQFNQRLQLQAEAFSKQMAMMAYGADKVSAADQALREGMNRGDPSVRAAWEQAMQSAHPYDVITRWHMNNETMREVGGDLTSYKKRVLEEALKDPDYQRQVIEASKGTATHVARPATAASSVPKIPSLGNIGAGGDTELQEPSDEQLFRAATTAKRR